MAGCLDDVVRLLAGRLSRSREVYFFFHLLDKFVLKLHSSPARIM